MLGSAVIAPELKWAFRGGLGFQCGRLLSLNTDHAHRSVMKAIERWGDGADGQFWFGLGRGLASKSPRLKTQIPEISGIRHQALLDGIEFASKRWATFQLGESEFTPPPDLRWEEGF